MALFCTGENHHALSTGICVQISEDYAVLKIGHLKDQPCLFLVWL